MHPDYEKAHAYSGTVIGAAIEVHRIMGPGLLESIYEKCLLRELELRGVPVKRQVVIPIEYKGFTFDEPLRVDLYVGDCFAVELKAVERVAPIEHAKLLSYMKLLDAPIGLLINFHQIVLKEGIRRMVLKGADGP
jgi:GxxExxY protein